MATQSITDFLKRELMQTTIKDVDTLLELLDELENVPFPDDEKVNLCLVRDAVSNFDTHGLATKYNMTIHGLHCAIHNAIYYLSRCVQAETRAEREFIYRMPRRLYLALLRGYHGDKTFESIRKDCATSLETSARPVWQDCRNIGQKNAATICGHCTAYLMDHGLTCPRACLEETASAGGLANSVE